MEFRSLGQAIDRAIEVHRANYPESLPYSAEVTESHDGITYWVTLRADHFSMPVAYAIAKLP